MGWRQELILRGISAATAAVLAKEGKDRYRKALEAAFPGAEEVKVPEPKPEAKESKKAR